jgi:hypothetical protein
MIRRTINILIAMLAARTVQDFLWGSGKTRNQGWNAWVDVLEKRIPKMRQIDRNSRHWQAEARKRLLQIAAVSIAKIEWIDAGGS